MSELKILASKFEVQPRARLVPMPAYFYIEPAQPRRAEPTFRRCHRSAGQTFSYRDSSTF